jgi:amidophosphoribosyltransferase
VFGIYLPPDMGLNKPHLVAELAFKGGFQNQHRGEESAGMVTADGYQLSDVCKHMGLISAVWKQFKAEEDLSHFSGHIVLFHNRYSTTGSSTRTNAGPFIGGSELGQIAVSHNGNLTNAEAIAKRLTNGGVVFKSSTDSEILANTIVHAIGTTWEAKISHALAECEGSFSLGLMTSSALYAARDNQGIRPLFWAEYQENGKSIYAVSSETPAFHHLNGFKLVQIQEVPPGTIIKFDNTGIVKYEFKKSENDAFCGLEITYLSRADGETRNRVQIDAHRRALGARLAQLHPPPEDIFAVTYIPESSRPAAEGFAVELSSMWGKSIPCLTSMIKGRYPSLDGKSRGFISPTSADRKSVAENYYPMDWVRGKKILVVDDSLIRGSTTSGVIAMLKAAGAAEIHLRIPWPPVIGFCPLGTDINQTDKLIWVTSGENLEKMRDSIGVASLAFLSPMEYQLVVDRTIGEHFGLCMGCTTGVYPVTLFQADKTVFEKKC